MSKRRDNRNRVLRNGESQRADGRYAFKYIDAKGETKFIYSWKLEKTDKVPAGKRDCIALREKEKEINRDIMDGIWTDGGNYTVIEMVKRYISTKTGVKPSTQAGYKTVVNMLNNMPFGHKKIKSVKLSDAKKFLIDLQRDGKSYSTIHTVRGVLRPAFQMAADDDLIRKNPFDFQLHTVVVNDSVKREALTQSEERKFLEFAQNDSYYGKYYEGIFILFNTGMRIGEFCGLTINDLDFENARINIDHQLQRAVGKGLYITETKTNAGTRMIPMTKEVEDALKKILKSRKKPRVEPMIDGKAGFLYINSNGTPLDGQRWAKILQNLTKKYNETFRVQIPKVTPHVCRHTYCSNMAKSGMNPKALQYLMGHSEIGVTLNTYTHLKYEDAQDALFTVLEETDKTLKPLKLVR